MRIHEMVTTGAAFLLPALCTVSCIQEPESADTSWTDPYATDDLVAHEAHGSRGRCEDACENTAESWSRFCSVLKNRRAIPLCLQEKNEGAGICYHECRNGCSKACSAISRRWELYCEERAPKESELACEITRAVAVAACHNKCNGRSLDVAECGDTVDG